MIRKVRAGYKVVSHKTGRSFGTYKSLSKAKARLKQIRLFSKLKKIKQ